MVKKLSLVLFCLAVLLLVTGMTGGCGETTHESSAYYYPNWMPDGRIICLKTVSRWSDAIWGRRELGDTNYITALTINDNNEIVTEENLFETSKGYAEIVCSPTGESIAVYTPGYPDGIWIYGYEGNKTEILDGVNVQSADWSPDATRIVYADRSRDMYIVNVNGTGTPEFIAGSAEAVAWRVGEKIAYEDSAYNKIWSLSSDGTSKEVVIATVSSRPQVSNAGTIIFRGAENQIRYTNITGTEEPILFSGYERTTLKLSFDNTKIVGGDLITGGGSWIGGIWVINIDGNGKKRLR